MQMQIKNPDLFREKVCSDVLMPLLKNQDNCINLEKGIFNWTVKEATFRKVVKKWDNRYFVDLYKSHLRSVWINLKNNPNLVASIGVEEGQIKPHEVAFMSHQVGSFLGAWGGGYIFNAFGNYDLAWKTAVAIGLAAGLFQMTMNIQPSERIRPQLAMP